MDRAKGGARALLACAIALLACASLQSQRQQLEELLRECERLDVQTGCAVVDHRSGRTLFESAATLALTPASNQKILTAAAALQGLAADYAFTTGFRLERGVLCVEAGGDPNWKTGGEHDPARIFAHVAAWLRAAGIDAVRGVVLETETFPGPQRPAGWPADQLQFAYCPPTGGLVLDAGCFRARIRAGSGPEAKIELAAPALALPVEGGLRLTPDRRRGSRYSLWEDGGTLVAKGYFYREAQPCEVTGTVSDPELLFRKLLREALAAAAIGIDPNAPERDVGLPAYRSSLSEALVPMLVDSSNFHAEQILRVLGKETIGDGSCAGGARALRLQIAALVEELPASWVVADGSGLARDNRVTARMLAAVLHAALRQPYGELLWRSLPRATLDGTLRDRFAGSPVAGRVRAKTGWIRGASALTGGVDARIFSILMRYDPDRGGLNATLKAMQERMVAAIAGLEDA